MLAVGIQKGGEYKKMNRSLSRPEISWDNFRMCDILMQAEVKEMVL